MASPSAAAVSVAPLSAAADVGALRPTAAIHVASPSTVEVLMASSSAAATPVTPSDSLALPLSAGAGPVTPAFARPPSSRRARSARQSSAPGSSGSALLASIVLPDDCCTLVLGDGNLADLSHPFCRVCALPNGRLSALRALVDSSLPDSSSVTKVFVCLSTLDRRNRLVTLTTCLKSLLSLCHRRFPNSTLFVVLPGIPTHFSASERATLHEFSSFVRTKHPSKCIPLAAPFPFECNNDIWNSSTKEAVYSSISNHLN